MTHSARPHRRYRPHLLALEPRMMFDAAAAVAAQDAIAAADAGSHAAPDMREATVPADRHAVDRADDLAVAPRSIDDAQREIMSGDRDASVHDARVIDSGQDAAGREIIFIDTSVDDYRQLAAEWAGRGEVVLIDGTKDGIDQVRSALAGRSDISAIHIVSHGEEGMFWLGTTKVDAASIAGDLAGSLGAIGRALAPGGDILIYGCDFAEGADGAQALAAFAQATHADVAASTDVTGFAGRGGDWTLEAHQGAIDARALSSADWVHTLDPNTPVPISVQVNSLTVKDASGAVVYSSANNYNNNATRSPDVGVGAVATWVNAANYQGKQVDLTATVVSLSTGDAVQFNRVTGTGTGPDDPTFLLRDLTKDTNAAVVQIRWELIDHATGQALPADVRFTIADIDGIDGNPNTRETVTASTDHLAYYTRERVTDIHFTSSLSQIEASGTQDENNPVGQTLTPKSAATFDWSKVSAFTLTYTLTPNANTTNAQFYHDGDADFVYNDPVYVSIPRLDLDGDDSTASGDDAHFTFTENGPAVPIVDSDIVVSNPMDINSITGGTVTLTNFKANDTFTFGTFPSNITASIGAPSNGRLVVTLSGLGSEADYEAAFKAITFSNTSDAPDPTQRVIEVSFSNDTLTSAVATSRIDIVPVNDPPTARNDSVSTPEDTAVKIAVLANDTDPDGDPLTVTAASALHGGVVRNADGTLTYTPNADYNGSDTISYTISDGHGGTSSATVAVTVTPVNDPPVARNDSATTAEDTAVTINVLGNDSDVEGDPLTVTAASAQHGSVARNADGTLTYTPDADYNGGDTISYTISDGHGGTASAQVAVTITPVNDAPRPVPIASSYTVPDGYPINTSIAGAFSDPDGDPLTYGASGLPAGLSFDPNTGQITGTVDRSASQVNGGVYPVTLTATDPSGASASQNITVNVYNPAPTARNDSATTAEDTPATINVLANDSDPDGDPLTVTAASAQHGDVVRNADGTLTYTPNADYNGQDTISYTISDGQGGTSSATVAVTVTPVNDAPVARNDSASTPEDRAVTIAVLANDTDVDGDALTVTAASAQHGDVVRNADGTLTYTPAANYNGDDTISYTISDGHGGTSSAVVAVRVVPQPDAPVNGMPPAQSVAEDTRLVFSAANGNAITIASPDGGQQTVTLTVSHGVFSLGGVNGLTFTAGDGADDTTMTFTGTVAAINAALDGSAFKGDADFNGAAALSMTTTRVPREGEDYQNAGAEQPVIAPASYRILDEDQVPGWLTTASDRMIEIWSSGFNGVPAYAGNQFFEINANEAASLYQEFRSVAGSPVTVDFAHRGRAGADTMRFTATDLGPDGVYGTADDVVIFQQDYTDDNAAWGAYSAKIANTASGDVIRLDFSSVSTASGDPTIGNFLDAVTVTQNAVAASDTDMLAITVTPVADIKPDSVTTPEDTAVVLTPLANDSFADPARAITAIDGHAISAGGAAVAVANGRVALGNDGRLTFTPTADYNGTTSFTYTVTAGGSTETATDTVVVTPVNDPPVANGALADRNTLDGSAVSYPTANGFRDADGDALTYSASGLPAGLSIDARTGVISGTVDRSASQFGGGRYTVTVTARDPSATSATQRFTIAVANPAPTAADDAATTHVDTAVVVAVLGNDTDPDGDPLTVTGATAGLGQVAVLADNTLRYTPPAGYQGRDTVTYTISDGQGGTATARVTIDVTNSPPTHDDVAPVAAQDGEAISLPIGAKFHDPEGDPLTFTATGLPPGLSIDRATGTISGTIGRSASQANGGVYQTVVTADDGHGGASSATLNWTIANPPPAAADDRATTAEDTPVTIAPLANDRDPDGDPLTIVAATAGHGQVAINPDGTLTYTPDRDFNGDDTILYTISDGEGGRASAQVAVTVTPVDDAPTTSGLPPRITADGATVSKPVAPAFADADGDTLTYSATGLPTGLSIDPATGVISGTIAPGGAYGGPAGDGVFHVVVTATDPAGKSVGAPFDWTVSQQAPTPADDRATTAEDTPVTIPVLANDSDPDGDPLTIVGATANHGAVAISNGQLVFTPDANFNGDATIVYTVADPAGHRATATVLVTVTPANDAPVADPLPAMSAADAQTISLPVGGFFSDADGDALRFSATGLPAGLSIDPATGTIAGVVERGASQATGGVYTVTLSATDPSHASATRTVTYDVSNPPPVARNDSASTNENTPVTVAVLANDNDPDGDPLTVVAAEARNGAVAINPDGTLAYTPDADFNGSDVIVYTISDGNGGSASASVLVTVTPVNDAPVARPDTAATAEDTPVTIAVLANDSDVDGDALTVTAASALHGAVQIAADGTLRYTPAADYNGADTITYAISDGHGGTASSTVAVAVAPVNDAPVARPDSVRTPEDTPVIIAVLANDSDVDGDALTVTAASASHGGVVINADGTLTYTPAADYNGADSISYTISDGHGGVAGATVAVTIDPVNDAPSVLTPRPTPPAARDAAPVAIDASAWFRDVDGDRLTYSATGLPAGVVIDPATGVISGAPDRSASQRNGGAYPVTVTARDPAGATGTASFTLTVTNPAPVAADDVARTNEDTGVVIPVLANDRDPDGDPLTVTAVGASHGAATINRDGTVTYVPGPNFAGTDTIRYTISDGQGGTATALVAVTIDPVNDAPVIAGRDPIDAIGGRPTRINVLDGVTDPDGDRVTVTNATSTNGVVAVNGDGTLTFTPALGFVGTTTIAYTVSDGHGGVTQGTLVVRVADGRGADIEQLLRIGRVTFRDSPPRLATVVLTDGEVRNPLSLLDTVEHIRSLNTTGIGRHPVTDAVEAIRALNSTGIDPDHPITAEVARLDRLRDDRDVGDRLFDQRWGDFFVKGMTGFSAAADRDADVMVESVVRGGAIYLEVRDTAPDGARAPIRSVGVTLAGGAAADWISVDHRGLAIIERAADMDELHLVVRVTRADGSRSATPIVIQGATGEVELDRHPAKATGAQPLDATLQTPSAAVAKAAARLASSFK